MPKALPMLMLAVLAACVGPSLPQSGGQPLATHSGVSPANGKELLYVSEGGNNEVAMFNYPGYHRVGTIIGLKDPAGVCADGSGHVWVVNSKSSQLQEYAHGGDKSIGSLDDSKAGFPFGCAVDATTGNLAVTDVSSPSGGGGVLVYADAKGSPAVYRNAAFAVAFFCAYDASGNLFIDGLDTNYAFLLMELPAGGKQLQTITLNGTIGFPGGLAWDGTYLAVGDDAYNGDHASAIDDISIAGSSATIASTVQLGKSCDVLQFAFINKSVAAPDDCLNELLVYPYPSGGTPSRTLNNLQYPVAAAFSAPPG